MSWLVPFVGILYFCLGLAIFNAGVFNNELGHTATATVTVSTLIIQPIATSSVTGYLPYKHLALPWLDNMEAVWTEENSERKERQKRQGVSIKDGRRYTSADDLPGCQPGMKSCRGLGHPEICCNKDHTCLPTNNTLTGVYCCRSPNPVALPCDDTDLRCEPDWYQCPASVNGGCCKYGQSCGLLECRDGDGPIASATAIASTNTLFVSEISSDSTIGNEENAMAERTTVDNMPGTNSTAIITSTSTLTGATATTILITGSPTITTRDTATTGDRAPTSTTGTGEPIAYLDPSRPGVTGVDSAAGSRAKVGRHWSWAVMAWWIIATIAEGV